METPMASNAKKTKESNARQWQTNEEMCKDFNHACLSEIAKKGYMGTSLHTNSWHIIRETLATKYPLVFDTALTEFKDEFTKLMAGKVAKSVVKAVGEYQYPWKEKLAKYSDELSKGVWGYWELGAWKDLGLSARRRARLRKEVLLAGQDWPYDPARKEMRTKRKGHKCDRVSAEKRAITVEKMKEMPKMLLEYKKRRWEKKMKAEDSKDQ